MDLTESLIKEREDMLREDSPGGRLLEDVAQQKAAAEDERDTTAVHKALEGANTDSLPDWDAYDYVTEYRDGNNLQADPETGQHKLSNKNFRPHQVTIAGHDLATGEKVFDKYDDVDGQISAGVSMLQDSHVDLDRGRPDTDAPALTRIAYALQMQGFDYAAYSRLNQEGWSEPTMVASWNAAMRGLARLEIEDQLNDYAAKAEAGEEFPDPDELDWGYEGEDIDPDDLAMNQDWLQACATMHEFLEGKPPPDDPEELAQWGKWQMAFFEMNTPAQTMWVARAATADDRQGWAIWKMMQMWNAVDISAGGVGRGALAVLSDPMTYITFGFGKLGTQAAAFAAKKAIMKALLSGTRGKIIGAATGAGISGANWSMLDETMRQTIAQQLNQQEGYRYGDIAVAGGLGFGLGGLLGSAGAAAASPEFIAMAKKLRSEAAELWASEGNLLRRLATEEDGFIEIRMSKKAAKRARAKRYKKLSETQWAKLNHEAEELGMAMAEPTSRTQAEAQVQIMDSMPSMPGMEAYRPDAAYENLATKKAQREFQWWQEYDKVDVLDDEGNPIYRMEYKKAIPKDDRMELIEGKKRNRKFNMEDIEGGASAGLTRTQLQKKKAYVSGKMTLDDYGAALEKNPAHLEMLREKLRTYAATGKNKLTLYTLYDEGTDPLTQKYTSVTLDAKNLKPAKGQKVSEIILNPNRIIGVGDASKGEFIVSMPEDMLQWKKKKKPVPSNVPYEDPEIMKFVKQYHDYPGQQAFHYNQKVGLSIDFSTDCPRRHGGKGACPYCYVDMGRKQDEVLNMKGANKGFFESDYKGELMQWPDSMIQELNKDGGIRMFSFGDFRPDIDDDNIAAVLADAQKRGLYVKAITKEPELLARFGDHPNLRVNLSIDSIPRAISNTVTIADAVKLKERYPNMRIRSVALNEDELIKQLQDPRIDLVTPYHGLQGEKLIKVVRAQNPKVFEILGDKEMEEFLHGWQSMSKTKLKKYYKKYRGHICCEGGKCSKDSAKCGFGLGALLLGVHLPDFYPEDYGDGDTE